MRRYKVAKCADGWDIIAPDGQCVRQCIPTRREARAELPRWNSREVAREHLARAMASIQEAAHALDDFEYLTRSFRDLALLTSTTFRPPAPRGAFWIAGFILCWGCST